MPQRAQRRCPSIRSEFRDTNGKLAPRFANRIGGLVAGRATTGLGLKPANRNVVAPLASCAAFGEEAGNIVEQHGSADRRQQLNVFLGNASSGAFTSLVITDFPDLQHRSSCCVLLRRSRNGPS